jgi:hypothetical protein
MKWAIDWGPVFPHAVKTIPSVDVATDLCQAIRQFAETGEGPVTRVRPDDPRHLRVRVPGAVAYMFVDELSATLYMASAYRRST